MSETYDLLMMKSKAAIKLTPQYHLRLSHSWVEFLLRRPVYQKYHLSFNSFQHIYFVLHPKYLIERLEFNSFFQYRFETDKYQLD